MRVLVTGGTGFIGSRLVERLLECGATVRCLVRGDSGSNLPDGVESVYGDITDRLSLRGVVDSVDQVHHLAAVGHVAAGSPAFAQAFHDVNVVGLQNLMDELQSTDYRGKLIHFSSTAAMGLIPKTACEESICNPETPYQCSKYQAEQVVWQAYVARALPAVILRPSMVYGPGDRGSDFLSMCKLVNKGLFPIPRAREALTPLVYVDDVVEAAILAGDRGVPGSSYIITAERSYPIRELVQAISGALGVERGGVTIPNSLLAAASLSCEAWASITGSPPMMTRRRLKSFVADRTFSISKAVSELGYQPKTRLSDGIARTIEWFKSTGRL